MADPRVVLVDVREGELSVDEVLDAVRDPQAGGIALFVGVIRDHDHGQGVSGLDYSAHPSAVAELRSVAEAVLDDDISRVAVVHRIGHLEIGDEAVVVAVSAPHRGEALSACKALIDTLKERVPIWKHQEFTDGSDEWVGL